MNVIGKLQELGYSPVGNEIYTQIELWKQWYKNSVEKFHTYSVWNGISSVKCRRFTVGMAKKVCEDWADLLLNEKMSIVVNGDREQEFIDRVLDDNNFRVKGNETQEKKAALGTAAYVIRAEGVDVDGQTGKVRGAEAIKIDYCTAPVIYPLSWENGIIKECAFASARNVRGKTYMYIQIHAKENGRYIIRNHIYEGGEEIPLASVPGFETVSQEINTDSDKPQFIIDRLNIANPDDDNPMGISVFASAIDQLKGVDIAYDSYVNEFVLGKKRIMVKPEAVKDLDGRPVFDPDDTVYYVLPEDSESGVLVEQVDMTLRTEEHSAGLQDMLNMLSSKCGFGENHYKFEEGDITTATQVISQNSDLFRTLNKHKIILQDAMKQLCRTILRVGNQYMNAGLDEDVEITIGFDDSIIEDKESKLSQMRSDADAGYIRPEIYVAARYNVDEAEALKMMPGMEELTTEEQDEVE